MKTRLTMAATTFALLGLTVPHLAKAGELKDREARQQERIEQGVNSGQLTGKETARLEKEQGKIEADREKALADGTMTKKEKAKLTREQNRKSRDIYRLKHNARRQPDTK
jgi:hypothetical protein